MKTLAVIVTVIACVAWAAICPAGQTAELPGGVPLIQVDWQVPQSLPPRFRNHCVYDPFSRRPYCSDHCGSDYQFYFCSRQSFGCCRVGFGYCDWTGLLRCHP